MKKEYITPEIDIEKFSVPSSVMTASSGLGGGGNEGDFNVATQREF